MNTSPIPAAVMVGESNTGGFRMALVVAKASFRVADGTPALDLETPLPILGEDRQTPLGILPADMRPKMDPGFEVMVLGRAHSPTGAPVREVAVRLQVGRLLRSLAVSGDRRWIGRGEDAEIGPAEPFTEMPLVWSRAYGGTAEIGIDTASAIDVMEPLNPAGRGFDHFAQAAAMADAFDPPDGYPTCPERRPLPNLEDPAHRIARWDDAPLPVCWAPTPPDSGMVRERLRRRYGEAALKAGRVGPERLGTDPVMLERAHPDLVIETPEEQAVVRIEGMLPGGREFRFRLPRAKIAAEMRVGGAETAFDLHPRALILMPEEGRFCLVFRGSARFVYAARETRVIRLTAGRGWTRPAARREAAPA